MSKLDKIFWPRFLLCAFSVSFLFLYTSQYRTYQNEHMKLQEKLVRSAKHSESLAAQLQLVKDKNERIEMLMDQSAVNHAALMKEKLNHLDEVKASLSQCKENLKTCELQMDEANRAKNEIEEIQAKSAKEISDLHEKLSAAEERAAQLQAEMAGLAEKLKRAEEKLEISNSNLSKCLNSQKEVRVPRKADVPEKQEVKATPTSKGYYVENGKVRFERNRPADEVLEFHRDGVPFEPPKLIPPKLLVEKLRKKNEEALKHPQDRDLENGGEVVDQPNENEKDYKDMH